MRQYYHQSLNFRKQDSFNTPDNFAVIDTAAVLSVRVKCGSASDNVTYYVNLRRPR